MRDKSFDKIGKKVVGESGIKSGRLNGRDTQTEASPRNAYYLYFFGLLDKRGDSIRAVNLQQAIRLYNMHLVSPSLVHLLNAPQTLGALNTTVSEGHPYEVFGNLETADC